MKSFQSISCSLPLLLATIACDAQVGENYRGEVMMQLQGNVELQSPDQAETLPALYFPTAEGRVLIRGEVEGVFPADFKMSVVEAPPEEALQGGVALGFVVLVEDDAPRYAPVPKSKDGIFFACDHYDGSEPCSFEDELCTQNGDCIQRHYECEVLECELAQSEGDPEVLTSGQELWASFDEVSCDDEGCLQIRQNCTTEDECYREMVTCEGPSLEGAEMVISESAFHECVVTEQSGKASLIPLDATVPAAENFFVLYVSEGGDHSLLSSLKLEEAKAGYNLVRLNYPTEEQKIEQALCRMDAPFQARDIYNNDHDTDHTITDSGSVPEGALIEIEELSAEFEAKCEEFVYWEIIDEPSMTELTIKIGSPPNL